MNIASFIGMAAMTVGALMLGGLYKGYLLRGQAELEEYLSFLKHLRRRVSLDAEPYSVASASFEGKMLLENGFLLYIREGLAPKDALDKSLCHGSVSEKERELIRAALGEIGKNALPDELKTADGHISLIEDELRARREENDKRIKSSYAVILAVTLGICILLL